MAAGSKIVRVKEFIRVLTFSASGRLRFPDKGELKRPIDGFFVNNYSSNEVWVNWDQEAALKGGDRIEAGDYRNIALRASKYVSVYSDGSADSVIIIGYREYVEPGVPGRQPVEGIGYEENAEARFAETVLRARR